MDNLKSTKFIFCMVSVIMSFILVIVEKIGATEFLTFVNIMGGTYIVGNVASKFIKPESAD